MSPFLDELLDVAAIDMLVRLFPDDVPSSHELRWRLIDTPKHDERRVAYLKAYIARVEAQEARAA